MEEENTCSMFWPHLYFGLTRVSAYIRFIVVQRMLVWSLLLFCVSGLAVKVRTEQYFSALLKKVQMKNLVICNVEDVQYLAYDNEMYVLARKHTPPWPRTIPLDSPVKNVEFMYEFNGQLIVQCVEQRSEGQTGEPKRSVTCYSFTNEGAKWTSDVGHTTHGSSSMATNSTPSAD